MKENIWFFISIVILISACSRQKEQHKTPTIDRETMAQIAADLHIIEAHLQNTTATLRDSTKSVLYHQFYKIHNIDSTTLYENQLIYYQNAKETKEMYDRVLDILEEKVKNQK